MLRYLTILLALCTSPGMAQNASLIFNAPEQPHLNLFLDGQPADSAFSASVVIDSLGLGEHTLDVQLEDSARTFMRTSLFAYPGITYFINLQPSETGWQLTQSEGMNTNEEASREVLDSEIATARPMEVNVFKTAEQKCTMPLTPQEVNKLKTQLKEVYFEKERSQLLADFFESSCFTVSQIRELIGLIDNESRRLDLIKTAYSNCFDRQHFGNLSNEFLLDKYATDFQTWLNAKK